jgi:hypothetical protein
MSEPHFSEEDPVAGTFGFHHFSCQTCFALSLNLDACLRFEQFCGSSDDVVHLRDSNTRFFDGVLTADEEVRNFALQTIVDKLKHSLSNGTATTAAASGMLTYSSF